MELTPDVFTADYSGEPGNRAFYLQARLGSSTHTVRVEKAQVAVLAEKLNEMLMAIDSEDTIAGTHPARDPALGSDPEEPLWRVGSMGLAYDDENDRFLVALEEVTDEEEDPEPGESLSLALRKDQVRAFILHALAIVEEGRPLCQLCGLPMDPAGHMCPASNGHHAQV